MKTEVSPQANVSAANLKQPQVAAGGNDPEVEGAVRRVVGIATLRRLRGMVNAEKVQEGEEARWAARLSWGFALAAVLTLAWLAFR